MDALARHHPAAVDADMDALADQHGNGYQHADANAYGDRRASPN
jgi:hypothetical protein